MIEPHLLVGARNCALDCAQIGKGSRVAIINEIGSVEEAVAAALEQVARDAGADVEVIWAPGFEKNQPGAKISADILRAFREAEIVISHYDSVSRSALQEHFPNETRVRVPNRATTARLLASPWARFPYGLQRAISNALEVKMAPGKRWRITSPAGTDLSGRFVDADSPVAAAFFQTGEDNNRARRNFPGGVHPPCISTGTEGTLVAEYVDEVLFGPGELICLQISDGRVTGVEGGDAAGKARQRVAESDGHFDSWHAGINPKTVVPVARGANSRKWFSYAHCSPQIVHFHLGRTHDIINFASFYHTLEIDGVEIFRDGMLTDLEGLAGAKTAAWRGVDSAILTTDPILI